MPSINACATLGFAAFPLETALEQIVALGFTDVELTHLGAYCLHLPMETANPQDIVDMVNRFGLRTRAMNISTSRMVDGAIQRVVLSDRSQTKGVVAYTTWYLKLARLLGAKCVSFPIGPRVLNPIAWKDEAEASARVFREIVAVGADLGVKVNLEVPHLFQLMDTIDHTMYLFDHINHTNLGATVDCSHWGIIGYNLDRLFSFLGDRLVNIHLRDSRGADTLDFKQELELTPGDGQVNFVTFGRALDRIGYQGNITLELEHRHARLADCMDAFHQGLEHLKTCGWKVPKRTTE
jgi:sugar phosphate isomerase/epimerase